MGARVARAVRNEFGARIVRASDGSMVSSVIPVATGNNRDISACLIYVHELGKYLMTYEAWDGVCGNAGQFIATNGNPGRPSNVPGPAH